MNGRRIVAMLIDYVIALTLAGIITLIVNSGSNILDLFTGMLYFIIAFLYVAFKDCNPKCASIGKMIMKIKVKYTKPIFISCILRGITLFLVPIEITLIAVNGNKRLGDMLANCEVVRDCE